eukprot:12876307-Alexandrium_andersonii.AAC.1
MCIRDRGCSLPRGDAAPWAFRDGALGAPKAALSGPASTGAPWNAVAQLSQHSGWRRAFPRSDAEQMYST